MSNKSDDVWALLRIEFSPAEWVQSLTPWGGDRAVIVTTDAVYVAEASEQFGYLIQKVVTR